MQESSPYATYSPAIVRPHFAPVPVPRAPTVWETYRSMLQPSAPATPLESAVTGLRHCGEGAAIAALLAFAHRHFGTLDVRGKYPVDGIAAALLFALSIREAGKPEGYAGDLRALSQSCSSVWVFRKLSGPSEPAKTPASTPQTGFGADSDPILQAARRAGF